jgi:glycosyltransferase involved in cell wall biosynthesis
MIEEKIDVCIPTWNSGSTLARCLASIVREIPVNKIRIIDGFSTDDTVKIAERYNALITQKKCGLGKARQYLIEAVTTKYFAFIDSDVILRKGWLNAILEKIDSDDRIGEVSGLFYSDNPQERHLWEIMYGRMRPNDPMWERGYLINTLVRTKAVKGVSIPEWMNNYEDKFIANYAISNGYKIVVTKNASCDHVVGESSFWKTCFGRRYWGAGLRFWKDLDPNISGRRLLTQSPMLLISTSYYAAKAKDPLIIPFKLFGHLFTIVGYFGSSAKLLKRIEKDTVYKRRWSKFKRNQNAL